MLIFISFFLLFAPFISVSGVQFVGYELKITYNGFEAISMFTNNSSITMIAITILLIGIIIFSIFESFYISKAKIFNLISFIIAILTFLIILISPNLIILEGQNYSSENFHYPINLKVGAIFILIFLLIYIILSFINLILYRKKEVKVLFKTK